MTAAMTDNWREVSVIIPAFNEERRLASTVLRIVTCLSGTWDYEIIVVDDGSTDGTAAVACELASANFAVRLLRTGVNRGKGFCVRRGMLAARKRLRLLCDADLSTPIEELGALFPWIGMGYDIVIGSRYHPDSRIEVRQSRVREILGQTYGLIVRGMFGEPFRDTQCGFKLFSERAAFLFELQRTEGFSFDVEILALARRHGIRVKEVGIRWRNDADSRLSLLTHPVRMLFELLYLRADLGRGVCPRVRRFPKGPNMANRVPSSGRREIVGPSEEISGHPDP